MAQAGLKRTGAGLTVFALGAAVLSGCTDAPADTSARAGGLPVFHVVPGSLLLPEPGPPRGSLHDTCGAAALAGLIGRPRKQIPVPVDLSRRRVACTACPVAPDVRLDRVNILYDAQTGLVTRITCG